MTILTGRKRNGAIEVIAVRETGGKKVTLALPSYGGKAGRGKVDWAVAD